MTQPHVEADCRRALITFVNVGSITMGSKTQPLSWLEAAELHRDGKRWRIHFFTSAPAPAKKTASQVMQWLTEPAQEPPYAAHA
ncbi:MAG TPA: hypothetical protein VGN24_05365 [Rhodanobacter sp.]|nr:hypothetical protein [Rhodanobacter sp.]